MKIILVCLLLPINLCGLAALFYFLFLVEKLTDSSTLDSFFGFTYFIYGLISYSIISLNLSVFLPETSLLKNNKYKLFIVLGLFAGLALSVYGGVSFSKRGLNIPSFFIFIVPTFIALYGLTRIACIKR